MKTNLFNYKALTIALTCLLFSTIALSANFYWVGGSGQINDFANHWATTSGGTTFHTSAPGQTDNLIFDSNSFTAPGQTVTETFLASVEANDFICTGTLFNPSFDFTFAPLQIYNSLIFESGILWTSATAEIMLIGTPTSNIIVDTKDIPVNNIYCLFPSGGTVSLASDLTCGDLDLTGVTLYTNNYSITATQFIASASATTDIYFGTSVITCNGNGIHGFDLTLANVNADSCTVLINDMLNFPFICDGQHFMRVISNDATIQGTNVVIDVLECQGAAASTTDLVLTSSHIGKMLNGSTGGSFSCSGVVFDTLSFNSATTSNIDLGSTDTLFVNDLLIINPGTELNANGGACVIMKPSGQVCTDNIILWSIEAAGGAQFYAGVNSIDNGGNTGWSFTNCPVLNSNVWPGDANYDLTVDNLDLINVGTNFGLTGPVRPSASNTYIAQPCPDWIGFFGNGVNYKQADCNGDGIVDADDTLAISLNYGQTHPARYQQPSKITSGGADLYFDLTGVTIVPGNTVTIPVKLGTASNTVTALYGTAFTINYNPAYVDAQGVSVSFASSWLSSGVMLSMVKDFPVSGKVDISLVRTDLTDVGGSGTIAEITFTIPLSATGNFYLDFDEVNAVLSNSNELIVSPVDVGSPTGIYTVPGNNGITFFPNPVIASLHIISPDTNADRIVISDMTGRVISSLPYSPDIDFTSFQKGVYLITLLSENAIKARFKISHL